MAIFRQTVWWHFLRIIARCGMVDVCLHCYLLCLHREFVFYKSYALAHAGGSFTFTKITKSHYVLNTYASICVHSFPLTTSQSMRKFSIKSLVQVAVSLVASNFVHFLCFNFLFFSSSSCSVGFLWKQDMYIVHCTRIAEFQIPNRSNKNCKN